MFRLLYMSAVQREPSNVILELLPVSEIAREIGSVSAQTVRRKLLQNEILGDAVLVENNERSPLFVRARLPQLKQLIEGKETR